LLAVVTDVPASCGHIHFCTRKPKSTNQQFSRYV
jgi:hypothetical protein